MEIEYRSNNGIQVLIFSCLIFCSHRGSGLPRMMSSYHRNRAPFIGVGLHIPPDAEYLTILVTKLASFDSSHRSSGLPRVISSYHKNRAPLIEVGLHIPPGTIHCDNTGPLIKIMMNDKLT